MSNYNQGMGGGYPHHTTTPGTITTITTTIAQSSSANFLQFKSSVTSQIGLRCQVWRSFAFHVDDRIGAECEVYFSRFNLGGFQVLGSV
jgi:hypothetical protein